MHAGKVVLISVAACFLAGAKDAAAAWLSHGMEQSNELVPVIQDGWFGYADAHGRIVIPPQFHAARNFVEGRACVQRNGRWGYIDPEGRVVVTPQYDWAYDFSQGIAQVGKGADVRYIDAAGRELAKPPVATADAAPEGSLESVSVAQSSP